MYYHHVYLWLYIWGCKVMHGYLWVYLSMHRYVWKCMGIYGLVWVCKGRYGYCENNSQRSCKTD